MPEGRVTSYYQLPRLADVVWKYGSVTYARTRNTVNIYIIIIIINTSENIQYV